MRTCGAIILLLLEDSESNVGAVAEPWVGEETCSVLLVALAMSSGSTCVERLDLVLAMLELRCKLRTCSWLEWGRDVVELSIGVGTGEGWVEDSEEVVGGLVVLVLGSGWDSAPAIFSTLVRWAPSEESWAGVLPAVASVDFMDGSDAASESFGSVAGVVVSVRSGVSSVVESAAAAVGVLLKLFFSPAFAAASAPACLIAIVNGESVPVLDFLSFSVELDLSFGSEKEMWLRSKAGADD